MDHFTVDPGSFSIVRTRDGARGVQGARIGLGTYGSVHVIRFGTDTLAVKYVRVTGASFTKLLAKGDDLEEYGAIFDRDRIAVGKPLVFSSLPDDLSAVTRMDTGAAPRVVAITLADRAIIAQSSKPMGTCKRKGSADWVVEDLDPLDAFDTVDLKFVFVMELCNSPISKLTIVAEDREREFRALVDTLKDVARSANLALTDIKPANTLDCTTPGQLVRIKFGDLGSFVTFDRSSKARSRPRCSAGPGRARQGRAARS